MASEFYKTILSTDKRYFFLEDSERESDGYGSPNGLEDLFSEVLNKGLDYILGTDEDERWWLAPSALLTFNDETN